MSARLDVGSTFRWNSDPHEITQVLPDTRLVVRGFATGEIRTVSRASLLSDYLAGQVTLTNEASGRNRTTAAPAQTLGDFTEYQRAVARFRLEVIRPLLALPNGRRTCQAVTARVSDVSLARGDEGATAEGQGERTPGSLLGAVSRASLYRWLKSYEESGNDIRALVPSTYRRGAPGRHRVDDSVSRALNEVLDDVNASGQRLRLRAVTDLLANRVRKENLERQILSPDTPGLRTPSHSTVARILESRECAGMLTSTRRSTKPAQTGKLTGVTRALARVEIDHTRGDIIVVDDVDRLPLGRPTITLALDAATRYPLGMYVGFEPPGYAAVMACLYHGILPKPNCQDEYGTRQPWLAHGIPDVIVTDNGREFLSPSLQDACLSLGITHQQMLVRQPSMKGRYERILGTCSTGVIHGLPGTTMSNPQQRGEYDSVGQATITLHELTRILTIDLVDVYAREYHRGLQGVPGDAWERAMRTGPQPRLPASPHELAVLLGRVEERTVQAYGVEFENLLFNSPDLAPLRARLKGQRTKIKVNPLDLSRIHVYDPFERGYIEAACTDLEYTQGMSLWKHRVVCGQQRARAGSVDRAELGEAKARILAIVADAQDARKASRKTKGGSARAARFTEVADTPLQLAQYAASVAPESLASTSRPPMARGGAVGIPDIDEAAVLSASWQISRRAS